MDNKPFGDKTLTVAFAKDRKTKVVDPGMHSVAPSGIPGLAPTASLYVSGLPVEVDKDYVTSLFSRFGEMDDVRVQGPK